MPKEEVEEAYRVREANYSYIKAYWTDNTELKLSQKVAVRFKYTLRYYIDDLLMLNNPHFEEEIPNIYPPQLVLKKTTEATNKLSYLDMCIHCSRQNENAQHWICAIHIVLMTATKRVASGPDMRPYYSRGGGGGVE